MASCDIICMHTGFDTPTSTMGTKKSCSLPNENFPAICLPEYQLGILVIYLSLFVINKLTFRLCISNFVVMVNYLLPKLHLTVHKYEHQIGIL